MKQHLKETTPIMKSYGRTYDLVSNKKGKK
ncbi:hypothetical protein VP199E371_P0027 [Vibrio phage 199E37-1]|nr:hypothetical protein VP199E371_P0027 [Vibrio phage 199E37-1]